MIRKTVLSIVILLLLIASIYLLGPRAKYPPLDFSPLKLQHPIEQLDSLIAEKESKVAFLKEDNQARIVWYDSLKQKTKYSLVYLHGYTASQGEGHPVHQNLAQKFHANLYLARLKDHGIAAKEAFKELTPQELLNDAKEAIAIGKIIGENVIVVSCSTGGTLSIILATEDTDIHSLVLLSPNINVYDSKAQMLTGPWGKQLLFNSFGEYRKSSNTQKYWSNEYHLNGLITLQYLLEKTMKDENFKKLTLPIYMGYYYKNDQEQDKVVSVAAMLNFFNKVSTDDNLKYKEAFPEAGNHVISSEYKNTNWKNVELSVEKFLSQHTELNSH